MPHFFIGYYISLYKIQLYSAKFKQACFALVGRIFVSKQEQIAYGSKYLWPLRMADRTI